MAKLDQEEIADKLEWLAQAEHQEVLVNRVLKV